MDNIGDGPRLVKVHLPWGEKEDFKGLINLLDMKAYPANGGAPVESPPNWRMPPKKPGSNWSRQPLKAMTTCSINISKAGN